MSTVYTIRSLLDELEMELDDKNAKIAQLEQRISELEDELDGLRRTP